MTDASTAFGHAIRRITAFHPEGVSPFSPTEDRARVRQQLTDLRPDGEAILRIYQPRPTAAFSPRDTTHPAYQAVSEHLLALGFTPVERGAGGLLAIYDPSALVIDLISPHPEPREHTRDRFRHFAEFVTDAFARLGIDAHVGAVPGEYCPGDYSINAGGRIKLAGLAQRVVKHGYHMGAVLSIAHSPAARDAVADAYRMFGLAFDPATFGAATELLPGAAAPDIRNAIARAIAGNLGVKSQASGAVVSAGAP